MRIEADCGRSVPCRLHRVVGCRCRNCKKFEGEESKAEVVCGTLAISRVSLRANQVAVPLGAACLPRLCLRCQGLPLLQNLTLTDLWKLE